MASTRFNLNRAPLWCGVADDSYCGSADETFSQLFQAIMSIWTKVSEEYFDNVIESMLQSIKAVLKAKKAVQTGI